MCRPRKNKNTIKRVGRFKPLVPHKKLCFNFELGYTVKNDTK